MRWIDHIKAGPGDGIVSRIDLVVMRGQNVATGKQAAESGVSRRER